MSKATGLSLARAVRRADAEVAAAETQLQDERDAERVYRQQRHGPGRPPAFAQRIQGALQQWARTSCERDQAQARQEEARTLIRALGEAYHPYDLVRGEAQSPGRLGERLSAIWKRLRALADAADLPARARAHLEKAQRLTTAMRATIAFFFATVQPRVAALNLASDLEAAVLEQLIPAIYLERVATRCASAEERKRLLALSAQRLAPLRTPDHPIQTLDATQRTAVEQVASECADWFQRSSSAVEGRNGQLSLFHHGCHRLSAPATSATPTTTAPANALLPRADGRLRGVDEVMIKAVYRRISIPSRPMPLMKWMKMIYQLMIESGCYSMERSSSGKKNKKGVLCSG